MHLNISYDANTLKNAPSGFFTAVNFVVSLFDATFNNNATVNIEIGFGNFPYDNSVVPALGESLQNNLAYANYSQTVQHLVNQGAPGSNALPSSAPVPGSLVMASAQEKALGLIGSSSRIDGWVGIASNATVQSQTGGSWSFDPTAAPGPNQYYLVGTIEHEISEVMGRTSYLDVSGEYGIMDLYRYAAPGIRQTSAGGSSFFSIDNGGTKLDNWNTVGSGDIGDWAASAGADAFDAFSNPGAINGLTATDITLIQALGWAETPQVGQQYVFSAPEQTTEVVTTTTGAGLPAGVPGEFNLELITSPSGSNYVTPSGYQGVAILPGGSGKTLQLLGGNFEVVDNGGTDAITMGSGNQTVIGAWSDAIAGGPGGGWIDASAGLEQVTAGAGHTTIIGGAGDVIFGSVELGTSAIAGARGDAIMGGYGADAIEGSAGGQAITAGGGNNIVIGGPGDIIFGSSTGTGNATIVGAQGDAIMGGYGTDRIDGSAGWQAITAGPGHTTVSGGPGDVIFGSTGNGSANIVGNQGDAIMGGSGLDLIDARVGGQPITGGTGSTTILGGPGDTIYGGAGSLSVQIDHSRFNGAILVGDNGTVGRDTVTGFSQGLGDRIFFANSNALTIGAVVASSQSVNGNMVTTFPDGSTMTLIGVGHIDPSFFV